MDSPENSSTKKKIDLSPRALNKIQKTGKQHNRQISYQIVFDKASPTIPKKHSKHILWNQTVFLSVSSVFFFAFFVLMVAVATSKLQDVSRHSITYYSGVTLVFLSVLFIYIDGIDLTLRKNFSKDRVEYFVLRCLIGFLALYSTVNTLSYTSLFYFYLVIHLHLHFQIFGFSFFYKQKPSKRDYFSFLFSLLVVSLSLYLAKMPLEAVFWAFSSTILQSVAKVMDVQVSKDYHSYVIILLIGLLIIILEPIRISMEVRSFRIQLSEMIVTAIVGIFLFFSLYYYHKAMEHDNFFEMRRLQYCSLFLVLFFCWFFELESVSYLHFGAISLISAVSLYLDRKPKKDKT